MLFDVAGEANGGLERGDAGTAAAAADLFDELLTGVLGVPLEGSADDGALVAGMAELVLEQRQAARMRRDFTTADQLRERLAELGLVVEDTPDGVRWRRSG